MNFITVSLGRDILKTGSRERERMYAYAEHLDGLHIIVLTRREHGYAKPQHDGSLHVYPTHSRNRLLMLWDAFLLGARIVKKEKRSSWIVSAQDPLEIGWACYILTWLTGAHFHVQVHGDYFSSDAWVGGSWTRRLRRRVAITLLRHAPAIRVVSERIRRSLIERGISSERITVLPIRPELEVFLRAKNVQKDQSTCTFLFLGRLAPEKDISRIIRAFARVHAVHPRTHLRIVGEGTERAVLESCITKFGLSTAVTMIPWVADPSEEMRRADVFLLASRHEAYALTLVEAMASGIPIVTTDVGCVGEVARDGEHGIVVYEGDDESYARAMDRMVTDHSYRKQCGERGRETALVLAKTTPEEYARAWVTSVSQGVASV